MSNSKWKKSLDEVNQKLTALSDRAKESAEMAKLTLEDKKTDLEGAIKAEEIHIENQADEEKEILSGDAIAAQMRLESRIDAVKGDLEAAKENCRELAERGEGKFSADLLKAQMEFESIRDSLKQKKDVHDAKKLEKYIDKQIEYALSCQAHAAVLVEEAYLSVLEALAASAEYEERYGDSEN